LIKDGVRLGLEIKRADAPRLTPSMRHAMADLKLDALWVLYPGRHRYSLADRVEVLPFATGKLETSPATTGTRGSPDARHSAGP
jgi:hypothetical protein